MSGGLIDLQGRPVGPQFDLVVMGSGAAALAAAITAVRHGMRVVVLEKTALLGGTTAISGGEVWVPRSAQAMAAGIVDHSADIEAYLRQAAGSQFDEARAQRYVACAAQSLAWLEKNTEVRYALMPGSPDYHSGRAGASAGGRSLRALPFDGRLLGDLFSHLRPPLANAMIFGGVSVCTGVDLPHLMQLGRRPASAWYAARLIARGWFDRARGYARGARLTNGNALVARLLVSLRDEGVPLVTRAEVVDLVPNEGRIVGVRVCQRGRTFTLKTTRGVVLAGGGFPASQDLKRQHYLHDLSRHRSLAPSGNTGDGLRLATAVGAGQRAALAQPAAWTPVSMLPHKRGARPFPHFGDKGRPGVLAVDATGRRFVNEGDSYHAFVTALLKNERTGASTGRPPGAWLIADHRALRRYGLGAVRPSPSPIGRHLHSGYLLRARSIRALAEGAGLDAEVLDATVAAFNESARHGVDPLFGRGSSLFNRRSGDVDQKPNPSLAPLETAPFYAVRVDTGDIGTFVGLRTDADARVLSDSGEPIAGLYAAGNDAASLFGGDYPAAGITLGPALTFGHLAALHASGMASGPVAPVDDR